MKRPARVALAAAAAMTVAAVVGFLWLLGDRPSLLDAGLPSAETRAEGADPGAVTVTFLGVTTLLFDDGETRILTDGFFSRATFAEITADAEIAPDIGAIESALERAGIDRLAAIAPVHSHFDHAIDTAEVARRTGALVVGSPSTANLARGAGLPEERILEVAERGSVDFGRFTLTLIRSRHGPVAAGGEIPFPGTIDEPLAPPAAVSAWREGGSYSIVIAHPRGTALVQGSAGYLESSLEGVDAQVVLLGIGGLARLGHDYTRTYWSEIVGRTGAVRVFPIHWDDFTAPYGEIRAFPRAFRDLEKSVAWLTDLAAERTPAVRIEVLPFAAAVRLF